MSHAAVVSIEVACCLQAIIPLQQWFHTDLQSTQQPRMCPTPLSSQMQVRHAKFEFVASVLGALFGLLDPASPCR